MRSLRIPIHLAGKIDQTIRMQLATHVLSYPYIFPGLEYLVDGTTLVCSNTDLLGLLWHYVRPVSAPDFIAKLSDETLWKQIPGESDVLTFVNSVQVFLLKFSSILERLCTFCEPEHLPAFYSKHPPGITQTLFAIIPSEYREQLRNLYEHEIPVTVRKEVKSFADLEKLLENCLLQLRRQEMGNRAMVLAKVILPTSSRSTQPVTSSALVRHSQGASGHAGNSFVPGQFQYKHPGANASKHILPRSSGSAPGRGALTRHAYPSPLRGIHELLLDEESSDEEPEGKSPDRGIGQTWRLVDGTADDEEGGDFLGGLPGDAAVKGCYAAARYRRDPVTGQHGCSKGERCQWSHKPSDVQVTYDELLRDLLTSPCAANSAVLKAFKSGGGLRHLSISHDVVAQSGQPVQHPQQSDAGGGVG
jgi:hypothetical protein